ERASLSMAPHSGVGGCAPMPRKERLAAVMMDVPIRIVPYTTMGDMVPGRIWRNMMTASEAPMLRMASMYVMFLMARVLPRTRRANAGTLNTATAMITFTILEPNTATTPMASRMP